jgi:hypothetical protein
VSFLWAIWKVLTDDLDLSSPGETAPPSTPRASPDGGIRREPGTGAAPPGGTSAPPSDPLARGPSRPPSKLGSARSSDGRG